MEKTDRYATSPVIKLISWSGDQVEHLEEVLWVPRVPGMCDEKRHGILPKDPQSTHEKAIRQTQTERNSPQYLTSIPQKYQSSRKQEGTPSEWEKATDKGLVSNIYQQLMQLIIKKKNNTKQPKQKVDGRSN